jgi:hypothetical protein
LDLVAAARRVSTGVLPFLTECFGPRTAGAGFTSITWPTTNQSNDMRGAARCCLTVGLESSWMSSCRTVLKSVLTQLWCTAVPVARLRLRHSPHLASSARPSCPKHSDDPQAAPGSLVCRQCWLRAVNLCRASLQARLAPITHDRPSDPARSSMWCVVPGRASWSAFDDHMRRRRENRPY